jgi:hypothetical protein
METTGPVEQPVRFYKFIALTFLFITIVLMSVIMFMSAKRSTIVIESKSSPVDITESLLVSGNGRSDSIRGNVTTKFVEIERVFYPTATEKKEAKSTGLVTLFNETGIDQPLIATTRLLSEDGVLFRLKDRIVVPNNGSIEAKVYADKEGEEGDIEPTKFIIPGLSEDKQKVIFASSTDKMTGGISEIGILGNDDMRKAKEVLRDLLQKQGEEELMEENETLKGVFSIIQDEYDSDAEVGDEISEFTLVGKATVLGIFYNEKDLQEKAEESLLRKAVDDIELIQPNKNPPTVTVEDYDLEKETATIQIFYDGVSVLNPESKQLEKTMFFGKNKEEVRRYLLKLDHVRSVEVKFTPAWIRTVPYVGEHVEVVVKEVE